MNDLLNISASPHIRDKNSTRNIMLDVIIALIPATIFGIYNFGVRALIIILISIATCVLTEYIYEKLMHKKLTVLDLSAAVTGLLIALNLPSSVPFWMPVLGGIFAIIVVKQLFGGIGQNFMNPALAARCFLLISFTSRMTTFTYDGITSATPLAILKNGGTVNVKQMFLGSTGGTIGETSVIALLLGAVYLLLCKVISIKIPGTYIGTFAICIVIYSLCTGKGINIEFLLGQLCGGGLMLGAFYMATDYTTSPITSNGKIIFGIILGILTFIFRIYGPSAEGVSYAIIFSNLLVPLIEKFTAPKAFGKGAVKIE